VPSGKRRLGEDDGHTRVDAADRARLLASRAGPAAFLNSLAMATTAALVDEYFDVLEGFPQDVQRTVTRVRRARAATVGFHLAHLILTSARVAASGAPTPHS